MKNKIFAGITAATMLLPQISSYTVNATDPESKKIDALQYTYEIIPLLEPFNEYFFIKTDNPHPESFRFFDKDSPYSETSVIYNNEYTYADVVYENEDMRRVPGGYIFRSFSTNGGEVTLQVHEDITREEFNTVIYGTPNPENTGYSPYHGQPVDTYEQHYEGSWGYTIVGYYKWIDTDVKLVLPPLVDDCDYLIQNYATKGDFFANMDAVQSGFNDICLYSGSYIRGELYRSSDKDWYLSPAGHIDQSFYIFSPYDRKDNKYLFASSLYPFRYDSLGFPGMMGQVSKRLSEESNYTWSDSSHAYINVTYNDETKTYGGAGNGKGQGLSEDKINRIFSFGENNESITLEESRKLLDDYAAIEMEDDIPREDSLTWEKIYDTVGDGAWVDMGGRYTYLYQKDDRRSFTSDEWGVGYSLYWGGSLGYCSDTWVDGRYINKAECFSPGAVLSDHPESNILIIETEMPELIDYERKWDYETDSYVYSSANIITTNRKNVLFCYDSEKQIWKADVSWGGYYNSFGTFEMLAKQGVIDEKYYEMLILTQDEAEAIIQNGNTNVTPDKGYVFDGRVALGEPFLKGDANNDGEISVADAVMLQRWLLAASNELTCWRNVDLCEDGVIDVFDMALLRRIIIEK